MQIEQEQMQPSRREANRQRVIACALACFIEKGIEASKVSEIAARAELTERSVFRYFENKVDLVMESLLLFWAQSTELADENRQAQNTEDASGIEQIRFVLQGYADLYFTHRREMIFVHEAEAYLNRCGKVLFMQNKPPAAYADCAGPLSRAIHVGVQDGTVRNDVNLENLYYNTFDAMLGLIQKMAIVGRSDAVYEQQAKQRLNDFCEVLVGAYRK